ncbi:PREDICTED: uncharacterized protein LOC109241438 isoform X2 [Nicotiana attenuata]|uniref:uncharacterized protein LOC109241438 isoform X2 n=1 Tax=Nicotiana attenuata TaxID=49451 RepID=UPI000905D0B9|nr:PREDICTED: uncharacterized protein LOC109241438 isoform X2 [Nicotiana attenuata]
MESLQRRVESWIRGQKSKILKITWPQQWKMVVRWPWADDREQRKLIQEEYERRKKQLQELCLAVKAESVADLQDILCCMVLSECVYKRPAAEMVRAVNKFKADFGGEVVSLERVQPSSDHVPHRYLLAEAGDTLFASFIGTKQYKDVMADVNIFQGALFHEDAVEDIHGLESMESGQVDTQRSNIENHSKLLESKTKPTKLTPKPAAHRGFMARAKGIPALELYRLAQKKKRKLVLCGHSLGGAVAVLSTLAILRVFAASSKENEKVQVKCITFSQPPVGNAALREYVNGKGWQHYFKTYCIPEDLVPRILSPAYFHHYNARSLPIPSDGGASLSTSTSSELSLLKQKTEKAKDNEGEQLVLGVGPVQNSFWRLSRLVPLEGVRKQLYRYRGKKVEPLETSTTDSVSMPSVNDITNTPQSLEIQEGSDGISLRPLPTDEDITGEDKMGKSVAESNTNNGDKKGWRRMPYLPLYVPFGQLFLLGNSSVEFLSGAEYSKLTSVRSVLAEVRERFQSHSMKSYRSRFQRIYELCMSDDTIPFLGIEQMQQFPQLQKWLGISVGGTVDLGHIVESPVIRTATSLVPLGWSGIPCGKNTDPLKVDISGFGLHLCTLVEARVNGRWCSTSVESFPSPPAHLPDHGEQPEVQNMRVLVGAPLRRPPKHHMVEDIPMFSSIDSSYVDTKLKQNVSKVEEGNFILPDGLDDFVIYCTTDFSTVWKEVNLRTRRVRLIGLEGSGKTSLLKAILDRGRSVRTESIENLHADNDVQEGIACGLCYSDSAGVNLQNLNMEATHFRDDLWKGIRDLSKKTDLVILVHNLSHRIPRYSDSNASQPQPAICLLLNEAKSLGIPWILAITNKFSVSAHQQKAAISAALKEYQASPSTTEVINSCPYVMPSAAGAPQSWYTEGKDHEGMNGAQKLIFAPLELVRRPFQKKASILPVDGVSALCELVHRVLRSHEEAALQEFARDRLFVELARERAVAAGAIQDSQAKANSLNAAAVGASLGAGLGLVLAVVMGAASALRKP